MKIRLGFKTPDVTDDADPPLSEMSEEDRAEAKMAFEKWIRYGEYLTIEIDTVTGTCTPIEVE